MLYFFYNRKKQMKNLETNPPSQSRIAPKRPGFSPIPASLNACPSPLVCPQPPVFHEDLQRLPGWPHLVLHLQQLGAEQLHACPEGVLLLLTAPLHHADQHHVLGCPQGPS